MAKPGGIPTRHIYLGISTINPVDKLSDLIGLHSREESVHKNVSVGGVINTCR